jgi:hypothetical protein
MTARPLTEVLADHGPTMVPNRCMCGAVIHDESQYRSHVAAAVLEWVADQLNDPATVAAFKAAWHAADERGDTGHRVEAGLAAVREQVTR